ncbi:hypothetical protein H7J74_02745 [Mycobacterium angelicum]|nr:hypothetical protein [Mycobacterium angelicum]
MAATEENAPETQSGGNNDETAGDTFPRSYVEDLRKESAGYRDRAKQAEDRADALAKQLHAELVKATGKLENPADLPFDSSHIEHPEKLAEAIDALLADRPYFAKRKIAGDIGQGNRGTAEPVSLLGLLKGAI